MIDDSRTATPDALYIHIPFCRAKCSYCDFASYPGMEHLLEPYVAALCTEISSLPARGWPIRTVYFGGGTPSLLSLPQVDAVLSACRSLAPLHPHAEISFEANPGTVDEAYLRGLLRLGVNRLSLGVQSLNDAELRSLDRIHTADEAKEAVATARRASFGNLSLDLIYGLPGQSVARWILNLEQALALLPDHLSLYALTVEEHTPLARAIACGETPAPDDDVAAAMYEAAEDLLAAAGYDHYEISNWARAPGLRCRHNLVYWHNQPYWGVGAAAHSWWAGRRYHNVPHPGEYIRAIQAGRSPLDGEERIDTPTEMGETAMLALRLREGLPFAAFLRRYGRSARYVFREAISECREAGLLEADERGARLTRRGRLLGNEVFGRFLRDAQQHRMEGGHRRLVRIGLTGNIACGKSTVAGMLADLGAMVIDADKVAHQVMRRGMPVHRRVVDRFGEGILGNDGEIDRARLGAIAFADPAALRDLDAIVHPAVIERVEQMIAAADPPPEVVVVEAIKLIEAGMRHAGDSLWVVTCAPETAVGRLMATRGLTEEQARARLAAQGSDAEKLRLADVVIRNDGDLEATRREVQAAWRRTVARASSGNNG